MAFVLYKPVANLIIENTKIDDNIRETITASFSKNDNTENNKKENMPSTMVENISGEIEQAAEEVKATAIEETTKAIINVASAILVFIAAKLILFIVSLFVNQITKLPIIKQVDKIGGIIYGLVEGMVIVYIVLSIISLASVIWANNSIVTAVTKSALGNVLYNNNIILKLLFK